MALINENIKQNLANNLVANYDEGGDGNTINGQPLQVTQYGNLQTTARLEFAQLQTSYSGVRLSVPHNEVDQVIQTIMNEMVGFMEANDFKYAYNIQNFIVPDTLTPNRYNLYITSFLSNL